MSLTRLNHWNILTVAVAQFFDDDVPTLAASLSFFTALSLAPLLVILVSVTDFMGPEWQARLVDEIARLIGTSASEGVMLVIRNVSTTRFSGILSTVVSLVVLLISSTAVFVQLQKSLNKIWGIKGPETIRLGREAWAWLRTRLLSLGVIIGIGFLLLVSLAISALLSFVFSDNGHIWQLANNGIGLLVYAVLFGAIFRILPDKPMLWRDVWPGATLTSGLFLIGKWAIGKYLGFSSAAAAYGAAGSLMVLLLWVYYASLVVFLGAEVTHKYEMAFRYARIRHREEVERQEGT
jgi:membrane protein